MAVPKTAARSEKRMLAGRDGCTGLRVVSRLKRGGEDVQRACVVVNK